MSIYERDYLRQSSHTEAQVSTFATRVYGWMAVGLALTAFIAYTIFKTGAYISILPYAWLCGLATLGIAFTMGGMLERLSFTSMTGLFLSYAAVQGVFFGAVLPIYAASYGGGVIWTAFASAAGLYGLAVGYGMITKSDLTNLGRLLNVALIGFIGITFIYVILSMFYHLPMLHLMICYAGLVMFIGLTAYDAQQIRDYSCRADSNTLMGYKMSLMVALRMYINLIMIFWYLLQILTSRRD
ncbi:MAG: FtsH-binding integral membrane protein [Chlamydiales bacterium]|jgi:FtsH-binding integral membrane protein